MSGIQTNTFVYLLGALVLILLNPAVAFADNCQDATFIDLNTSFRSHGNGAATPECFETHLPSTGYLVLEANVPSDASAEPVLDFRGPCDPSLRQTFLYQDRSAAGMLLEIREAGTYSFCVASQDPAQILGRYQIANGFAPLAFFKENPDEDEPEPDPLVFDPSCPATQAASGNCSGSAPADGFYKENPDEDEPEPDPLVDPCTGRKCLLEDICRANTADDHGGISRCATPTLLGQEIGAEIRNGWGDDADVFSFDIDALTSVRIETTGAGDTLGALFDRRGYRLKVDNDGGIAGNFRIVKTLSAGRYYVRVEGSHGTEGAYSLLVEALGSE